MRFRDEEVSNAEEGLEGRCMERGPWGGEGVQALGVPEGGDNTGSVTPR